MSSLKIALVVTGEMDTINRAVTAAINDIRQVAQVNVLERTDEVDPRDEPIEILNLPVRQYNALKRAGVNTLGELGELIAKRDLIRILVNVQETAQVSEKVLEFLRAKL